MTSSVARMPREEWAGQSIFVGSHGKHLKKLHVPKIAIPPTKGSQSFNSPKPNTDSKESESEPESDTPVLTPSRRHHQKILDRWAARQAREMVTTIERQTHEAEISALTNMSQPVSKRAQCFLHRRAKEASPTPSDMSVASAPGADVLQTVRASSLIQMWRDLEGSTPRCGTTTPAVWPDEKENGTEGVTGRGKENGNGVTVRAMVRGRGEIEELVARMEADRRRDLSCLAERHVVSRFAYRGRLQSMLKLRFLRKEAPVWEKIRGAPVKAKPDQFKQYSVQCSREILATRQNINCEVEQCNNLTSTTDESSTNSNIDPTIDSTADSGQVSQDKGEHDKSLKTKPEEIKHNNQLKQKYIAKTPSPKGNNITSESQQDEQKSRQAVTTTQNDVTTNNVPPEKDFLTPVNETIIPSNMKPYQQLCPSCADCATEDINGILVGEARAYTETISSSSERNSPSSMNEDEQEEENVGMSPGLSPGISWDDRNLWLGSVDWQRSAEPTTPYSWRREMVPVEDLGAFPWSCDSPNSWRALVFRDVSENISDNMEIRDLLERKRVTTTLESDFCVKMNRLILSLLQTQCHYNNVGDNFEEEHETKAFWRLNYERRNDDPVLSAESSLVPFNYQNSADNSWQTTTFTHNLPQISSADGDSMNQLKSDMTQIHDEISELRKLVESCVQWQVKLQDSIKQEVTNAIYQAVGNKTISSNSSSALRKEINCSICKEAQINSLLYRCGHMCACFKCAHDLQSNNQRCPICQSVIEDVVRVNPN